MRRALEQEAREKIDAQLEECGWLVQDSRKADFSAGRGIALREVRLKSGPCDYLLLVAASPLRPAARGEGARRADEGFSIRSSPPAKQASA